MPPVGPDQASAGGVVTAEDLKVLSETELREELDNLRRPYRERMAFLGSAQ